MSPNHPIAYTASAYDRFTADFLDNYDRWLVKRVVTEFSALGRPARLLDIGTGTARLLFRLAPQPDLAGLYLLGLDRFSDVLAQAQATLRQQGPAERLGLIQADVHLLPFADQSFELIISRSTIHHWAAPVQALAETFRVLSPGGVAIIHEVRRDPAPEALAAFNSLRVQAGLPPSNLEGKYTAAEALKMCEQAGLSSFTSLSAPAQGPGALGFELCLRRPVNNA